MKKHAKKATILLILVLILGVMAGCTPSYSSQSDDGQPTTLNFIADQPNTLNPILSASNLDSYVFYLTQAMLFRTYDGVTSPEVCDNFTVSEDNMVYTYTLKDAVFADGTPITAEHFAYYILARLDPEMGSPGAQSFYEAIPFKNAAAYNKGQVSRDDVGVKVIDDKTLEITLEYAVATFDGSFTAYPLREEFVRDKGEALGGTPQDLEYSGPYILTEWVYDSHLTFEKNPLYINAETSFPTDNLKLVISTDANTSVAMFQNGEVDLLWSVGAEYIELLEGYLVPYSVGNMLALQFNSYGNGGNAETARVMQNKNFRLALSYALDRETIIAAAMPNFKPITRLILEDFPNAAETDSFVDTYQVNQVPINGDTARAKGYLDTALEELGYSSVSELPKISYLSFNNPGYKLLAETFVDQWKQILGLECFELNLLAVPMAIQAMMNYEYDVYLTSLGAGLDPSELLAFFKTGGSINDLTGSGKNIFSDNTFDSLINQAQVNFDKEARYQLLVQAEQILLDSGVLVPVCSGAGFSAVQPYVEGYIFNRLDDGFSFNQLVIKK